MNALAIVTAAAAAFVSLAGGRPAQADRVSSLQIRQINTAPRLIGCSHSVERCDGATSIRTGLVVVDVASRYVRRGPVSLVGMFQASAQPRASLLGSQLILGGGARIEPGRGWLQAGLGLAGAHVAPGPKTIAATSLLSSFTPAAMAGVGTHMSAFAMPIQLSLDLGISLGLSDDQFSDIYQVTANVLATNL
jgi:hypothetical protein